jgi:hypothetical protein
VKNCFNLKNPDEDRTLLERFKSEPKKVDTPMLPSIGTSGRLKVILNGRVEAEAVLDIAASHTFVSQDLVEKLGIKVVDQEEVKEVSWVARDVCLPIVGTAHLELLLSTEQGTGVVLRKVKVLILSGKLLENSNLVFIGTAELYTLGIQPFSQLRKTLRKNDEGESDSNLEGGNSHFSTRENRDIDFLSSLDSKSLAIDRA